MKASNLSRRQFIAAASVTSLAAATSGTITLGADVLSRKAGKLALLGGEPVRKNKSWPDWPHVDQNVIDSVVKTTKSGIWCRIQSATGTVPTFEKAYAELMGTKRGLAVAGAHGKARRGPGPRCWRGSRAS